MEKPASGVAALAGGWLNLRAVAYSVLPTKAARSIMRWE
jgi:hypothetical protein